MILPSAMFILWMWNMRLWTRNKTNMEFNILAMHKAYATCQQFNSPHSPRSLVLDYQGYFTDVWVSIIISGCGKSEGKCSDKFDAIPTNTVFLLLTLHDTCKYSYSRNIETNLQLTSWTIYIALRECIPYFWNMLLDIGQKRTSLELYLV